jgi:hypothetical protein
LALHVATGKPRDSTPLREPRKAGKVPAMRLVSYRNVVSLFASLALASVLTGCPEKGAPADKTTAEPERAEPDDEGKAADAKKPPAPPAAAPADDKKPDDDKDKGGW